MHGKDNHLCSSNTFHMDVKVTMNSLFIFTETAVSHLPHTLDTHAYATVIAIDVKKVSKVKHPLLSKWIPFSCQAIYIIY